MFVNKLTPGEVTSNDVSVEMKRAYEVDLPSLDHELLDNAVEGGALIAETLLASSKRTDWCKLV